MNLEDLWIGDLLWVGEESATFEGIDKSTGMALVKVNKEVRTVAAEMLSLRKPEQFDPVMDRLNNKIGWTEKKAKFDLEKNVAFKSTLDLHIIHFPEYNRSTSNLNELEFQLSKARKFVQQAVDLKVQRVVLIHGHGKGKLRDELIKMLQEFEVIDRCEVLKDGAALEVWMDFTGQ